MGRELTQRWVCVGISSRGDEGDERMDPGLYAKWLMRHQDLVDEEGRLRDEPRQVGRSKECVNNGKRPRSPYPTERMGEKKGCLKD